MLNGRSTRFPAWFAAWLALALTPSERATAEEVSAQFELTVEVTWSVETAPLDFPDAAHLSGLIGATHNGKYVLFRDGRAASSGLELVAENGRVAILKAELAEASRRGRLGGLVEGPALAKVPGRLSTRFEAVREHPLLSFVTMLAPSPDWFTGAADISLMAEGKWIDRLEVPLWAWDAGTDSGQSYRAGNSDTQPRQSVRLLASQHFLGGTGLVAVGKARLRRLPP